jgi:hypothetical protein
MAMTMVCPGVADAASTQQHKCDYQFDGIHGRFPFLAIVPIRLLACKRIAPNTRCFVRNRYALPDVILAGGAGFFQPSMAEGAEQTVEKELRLALFVAANLLAKSGDELSKRCM